MLFLRSPGSSRWLLVTCSVLILIQSCAVETRNALPLQEAAKIILIIGDGMDDQQITIARNYLSGSSGQLKLDEAPFRGAVHVETMAEDGSGQTVYVADSASSGTAMATGVVTSLGRIATTAATDERVPTIMELAQIAGMGTGIVTTSSLTDATPASFVAHINRRYCQGPADMVSTLQPVGIPVNCSQYFKTNGERGSIAEQIAASDIDILFGGGTQYFEQFAEGSSTISVIDEAVANGYQVIRTDSELANTNRNNKVLGLFSPSTMPVRWRGVGAQLVEKVDDEVQLPAAYSCEPNPRYSGMPSLADMTAVALNHFEESASFMLMVESASIDKQSHVRRPCGSIGELAQLNEALAVALEYAQSHPETLILITADHAQAAQMLTPEGSFLPLNFSSPGYFARVLTPEGSIMGVNYATNESPMREYHTGAQVPLYAFGAGANTLPTFIHQAEIFNIMAQHLGLHN